MQMFHLDKAMACEFFELYKGVSPVFNQMTDYVATGGPVIAMEIRQEHVVEACIFPGEVARGGCGAL